jgi:hypothetical protein
MWHEVALFLHRYERLTPAMALAALLSALGQIPSPASVHVYERLTPAMALATLLSVW